MEKLCIGLAAPCDPPEVEEKLLFYFTEKFEDATSLPFAAFMTHDFQWVHGFSGRVTAEEMDAHLKIVEASPLVPTTLADEKKLEAMSRKVAAAADEEVWAKVLSVARDAAKIRGRSEAREKIEAHVLDARDWAQVQFDWAEQQAVDGAPVKDAQKLLRGVAKTFKGEPEADEALLGVKAVARYAKLAKLPEDKSAAARAKAAKEFAGTRWAALFETSGD